MSHPGLRMPCGPCRNRYDNPQILSGPLPLWMVSSATLTAHYSTEICFSFLACGCIPIYVDTHKHVCACTWKHISDVQGLSSESSACWCVQLASLLQGSSASASQHWNYCETPCHMHGCRSENLNSGPHTCAASALATKPSSQPPAEIYHTASLMPCSPWRCSLLPHTTQIVATPPPGGCSTLLCGGLLRPLSSDTQLCDSPHSYSDGHLSQPHTTGLALNF